MDVDIFYFDGVYFLGVSVMHPIELLATCPGVLILLEGIVVAPTQTRRQQPTRAHSTEESRSLSDLGNIGCKPTAAVHFSPFMSPLGGTMGLINGKNCPRWGRFSLRCPKSDRLLG